MNPVKIFIISALIGGVLMAESSKGLEQAKAALVKQDYTTAFTLFSELAEKGDMKAQYFCAGMYELGHSIAKDDVKALYWYEKAAEQGMKDAQQTVAFRYMQGVGTPVDQKKAAYWYDKIETKVSVEESQVLAQWFDPNNTFGTNN